MASVLKVGPMFSWPHFPDFPDSYYDADKVVRSKFPNRYFYDWTVFTPEGLAEAERYWDAATAQLAALLPARLQRDAARWTGINLGTFDGTFQKAWMRRGYAMYGIELADTMEKLHAYGCEGHRDNVFDLKRIADGRYDFGVLDRVLCKRDGQDKRLANTGQRPALFSQIRRILKNDGAFIGVLYEWYDGDVVAELASLGGLTLWPHKAGRLAFCVDLAQPATEMPDKHVADFSSAYFIKAKIGNAQVRVFVPTNEIVAQSGGNRAFAFAPLDREAARGDRKKRAVVRQRFAGK